MGSGDGFSGFYHAQARDGFGLCGWEALEQHELFEVSYAPGGAWAWPQAGLEGEAVSVVGADEAIWVCRAEEGYCHLDALVGETWVRGSYGSLTYPASRAVSILEAALPSLPVEVVP